MISDFQHFSARRAFFVNYARKKGFDPLVPDNWYHQVRKDFAAQQVNKNKNIYKSTQQERKKAKRQKEIYKILLLQGGKMVLDYYGGGFRNALTALFPEIGLDKSKLFKITGMNCFNFRFLQVIFSILPVDFNLMIDIQLNGKRRAKDELCWKRLRKRIILTLWSLRTGGQSLRESSLSFPAYTPSPLLYSFSTSPLPLPLPSPPPPLPQPYPPLALPLKDHHLIFNRLQVPSSNTATTTAWKQLWRLCSLK